MTLAALLLSRIVSFVLGTLTATQDDWTPFHRVYHLLRLLQLSPSSELRYLPRQRFNCILNCFDRSTVFTPWPFWELLCFTIHATGWNIHASWHCLAASKVNCDDNITAFKFERWYTINILQLLYQLDYLGRFGELLNASSIDRLSRAKFSSTSQNYHLPSGLNDRRTRTIDLHFSRMYSSAQPRSQ